MRPVVDELNVLLSETDGEAIPVARADMARWRAMLYAARNKNAGQTIQNLQAHITKLNAQLDALGRVWCDGGCNGGMHRFQDNPPTIEQIMFIVRNAVRAMTWWINHEGKGKPAAHWREPFEAAKQRLLNTINSSIEYENMQLRKRITELQEAEAARIAAEARARPNHLKWNGTEWVDDRCGCRYHPDDDNGTHGGAPHIHRCAEHE